MTDSVEMALPARKNIDAAINIYAMIQSWQQAYRTIAFFFGQYPSNSDELAVVIKVVLVNSLYNTMIRAPQLMAKHILSLQGLDQQLQAGHIHAVDKVANCDTIGRNLISFASKYAHFSNMAAFPMYDKYVCISMGRLIKRRNYTVGTYEDFFTCIELIRKLARLTTVSWSDWDKYLWLYGQRLALDKGEDKINHDITNLYGTLEGRALFDALEPSDVLVT